MAARSQLQATVWLLVCAVTSALTELGCFDDGLPRALRDADGWVHYFDDNYGMTKESCVAACEERGNMYAATQAGKECFCGDLYYGKAGDELIGASEKKPDSECNVPCSGDASETCGGYWRNWLMETAPEGEFEFEGCFQEKDTPYRLFNVEPGYDPENTIERCCSGCRDQGAVYCGLGAGTQCSCGSSLYDGGEGRRLPDDECNVPCVGQDGNMCGGYWRLSVYRTGADGLFSAHLAYAAAGAGALAVLALVGWQARRRLRRVGPAMEGYQCVADQDLLQ